MLNREMPSTQAISLRLPDVPGASFPVIRAISRVRVRRIRQHEQWMDHGLWSDPRDEPSLSQESLRKGMLSGFLNQVTTRIFYG